VSGVPPPKVVAPVLHHLAIQFGQLFRKIIKIVDRSHFKAGAVGSAPGPPGKSYSAPSALAEPREVWGLHHFWKIWVSQFVEICIEIQWGGWGGIQNMIEYRLRRD